MMTETKQSGEHPLTQQESCEFYVVAILSKCATKLPTPRWARGNVLYERGRKLKNGLGFSGPGQFRDCMAKMVDSGIVFEESGRTRIEPDFAKLKFRLSTWFYCLLKVAQESVK